ncbi:MAG: hypothetical protein ACOY94_15500 [Bacillota bacterium]
MGYCITKVTAPLIHPTYLPEGYQLGGVWVDRFPMVNRVRVSYRFHWPADPHRSLQIDLDPGPGKVEIGGEPEPEKIQVKGREGLYQELVRDDATVRGLVFYRTDLSVHLVSIGLSRSEMFRIAESMAD